MPKLALQALLALGLIFAVAAPAAERRIDQDLDACLDKNPSTAGMIECQDRAYAAWDKALNLEYKSLMQTLAAAQQQALRDSQLRWIAFRDAEFKALEAIYGRKEGTLYLPMHVAARAEIVKSRVRQLDAYHRLVND